MHDFGDSAIHDANDGSQDQGFNSEVFPVGNELLAVAPYAEEGETGVHEDVNDLVQT